jgi:LPS O-antigen subunit length determinant protein (WzzB/FepE family)
MTVAEAENTAPPLDETAKKVEQRNVFSVLWGILKWVLLIVFILAALAAVSVLIYIIAMRRKARKKRDAAFWERRNVNK